MNKLIYLAGMLVAGFLLFQVNSGKIVSNDVLNIIVPKNSFKVAGTAVDRTVDRAIGYFSAYKENIDGYFDTAPLSSKFASDFNAAVIPYNFENFKSIAGFFSDLKLSKPETETFVIIADNEELAGHFPIAFSEYGYLTEYGKLEPNIALANSILSLSDENRVGFSYRAFHGNEAFSNLAPFIKKTFPDAKILAVSVKNLLLENSFSYFDKSIYPLLSDKNIVILAPAVFSKESSGFSLSFHNEYANEVLETLDDADRSNLRLLFEYLKSTNSSNSSQYYSNPPLWTYSDGANKSDRALTMLAFGDMMLGRYVRTLMDKNGMDYIFDGISGDNNSFFNGSDFTFANLEGPIKGSGYNSGTSLRFGFNEDVAGFLKSYGFNLLSITNNHAVDQGWDGRDTTISALNLNGISWCGHPSEADPNSVYYSNVGDKRVAVLCFQDVTYKLDDEAAVNLIKSVRGNVDYLIVSVHWGYEYKHKPDFATQIEPAHAFIDAGADFIIGHHPHVVQSFEIYNGKFIFYSLGNFVFDQYWSVPTQEELALGIVLEDSGASLKSKVYLFPMKSDKSQPRLMTDKELADWIELFISYGDYSEEIKAQIRSRILSI